MFTRPNASPASGFGNTSSGFGTAPAAPKPGAFGNSNPSPFGSSSGMRFGSQSATNSTSTSTGLGTSNPFGASTSSSSTSNPFGSNPKPSSVNNFNAGSTKPGWGGGTSIPSTNTSANPFASTMNSGTASSFGSPTPAKSPFGASNASNPAFGSSSAATNSSPFGKVSTSNPFGNSSGTSTGTQSANNPFGSTKGFGSGPGKSPFGATGNNTSSTKSPFGNGGGGGVSTNSSNPFSVGKASSSKTAPSKNPFGNNSKASTVTSGTKSNPFGATKTSSNSSQSTSNPFSKSSAAPSAFGTKQVHKNPFGSASTKKPTANPFGNKPSAPSSVSNPFDQSKDTTGSGLNPFETQTSSTAAQSTPFGKPTSGVTAFGKGTNGSKPAFPASKISSFRTTTESKFGTSSGFGKGATQSFGKKSGKESSQIPLGGDKNARNPFPSQNSENKTSFGHKKLNSPVIRQKKNAIVKSENPAAKVDQQRYKSDVKLPPGIPESEREAYLKAIGHNAFIGGGKGPSSTKPNNPFRPKVQVQAPSRSPSSSPQSSPVRKRTPASSPQGTSTGLATSILASASDRKQLDDAVNLEGTCPDMCYVEEREFRTRVDELSVFEKPNPGSNCNDPTDPKHLIIKRFQRSSADHKLDIVEHIRPPGVLRRTLLYIENFIMDREQFGVDERFQPPRVPDVVDLYNFVWDRTRMIRKDLTLQNFGAHGRNHPIAIDIHERIARFHILAEHELVEEKNFIAQQNMEQLGQTLKTLNEYYAVSHRSNDVTMLSPFEPEFRAYFILCTLENSGGLDVLEYVMELKHEIRQSPQVQFALEIFRTRKMNDYYRFFKLMSQGTYLQTCLLHRYLPGVRANALQAMNRAYRKENFPLQDIVEALYLEDIDEAAELCAHHGLEVDSLDDDEPSVTFGGPFKTERVLRAENSRLECRRSLRYISPKRGEALKGAICRGVTEYETLPPLSKAVEDLEKKERAALYPSYPIDEDPHTSFVDYSKSSGSSVSSSAHVKDDLERKRLEILKQRDAMQKKIAALQDSKAGKTRNDGSTLPFKRESAPAFKSQVQNAVEEQSKADLATKKKAEEAKILKERQEEAARRKKEHEEARVKALQSKMEAEKRERDRLAVIEQQRILAEQEKRKREEEARRRKAEEEERYRQQQARERARLEAERLKRIQEQREAEAAARREREEAARLQREREAEARRIQEQRALEKARALEAKRKRREKKQAVAILKLRFNQWLAVAQVKRDLRVQRKESVLEVCRGVSRKHSSFQPPQKVEPSLKFSNTWRRSLIAKENQKRTEERQKVESNPLLKAYEKLFPLEKWLETIPLSPPSLRFRQFWKMLVLDSQTPYSKWFCMKLGLRDNTTSAFTLRKASQSTSHFNVPPLLLCCRAVDASIVQQHYGATPQNNLLVQGAETVFFPFTITSKDSFSDFECRVKSVVGWFLESPTLPSNASLHLLVVCSSSQIRSRSEQLLSSLDSRSRTHWKTLCLPQFKEELLHGENARIQLQSAFELTMKGALETLALPSPTRLVSLQEFIEEEMYCTIQAKSTQSLSPSAWVQHINSSTKMLKGWILGDHGRKKLSHPIPEFLPEGPAREAVNTTAEIISSSLDSLALPPYPAIEDKSWDYVLSTNRRVCMQYLSLLESEYSSNSSLEESISKLRNYIHSEFDDAMTWVIPMESQPPSVDHFHSYFRWDHVFEQIMEWKLRAELSSSTQLWMYIPESIAQEHEKRFDVAQTRQRDAQSRPKYVDVVVRGLRESSSRKAFAASRGKRPRHCALADGPIEHAMRKTRTRAPSDSSSSLSRLVSQEAQQSSQLTKRLEAELLLGPPTSRNLMSKTLNLSRPMLK